MSETQISERFTKGTQSWTYQRVLVHGEHKLAVEIKRDAYDFQSYAWVRRWDGSEWRQVCGMPMDTGCCRSYSVSYVAADADIELFRQDAAKLLAEAVQIID